MQVGFLLGAPLLLIRQPRRLSRSLSLEVRLNVLREDGFDDEEVLPDIPDLES